MKSTIALSKTERTPTRGPKVVPSQLVADADDRRRADLEAAGQIAVGLALAQVATTSSAWRPALSLRERVARSLRCRRRVSASTVSARLDTFIPDG
jgi:hypothetical protein